MAFTKALGGLVKLFPSMSLNVNHFSTSALNYVQVTSPVFAMPQKKKRKIDPMLLRAKEDKRIKRIERALKKMQKKQRLPKPLKELEPPQVLLKELNERKREVVITEEMADERAAMFKAWAKFTSQRHTRDIRQIDNVIYSQKAALEALRGLDLGLYKKAIALDATLLPFKANGPTLTPPIPGYFQDGEYEDVTKQYSVQYGDTRDFLKQLLASTRKRKKKKVEEDDDD